MEQAEHPALQARIKVDHHVAAADQVGFRKHAVGCQAVVGEGDVLDQRLVEQRAAVRGRVVIGKHARAAGGQVVLCVQRHLFDWKHAAPGNVQRLRVDVGGVNHCPLEQAFFAQQDRHRHHFLAGAAAGNPDVERCIGVQERHHVRAQRGVKERVAEHLGDRDRQELQQLRKSGRIVHHPRLQGRNAGAAHFPHRVQHPALLRGPRVVAKIVVVLQVDGFDQQLQFDVGGVQPGRHIRSRLGIHTRSSESRRFSSIGLAR